MQFSYDRTGFPLISIPQAGLEVQLLPVTKVQFERFLAEPNEFGDRWYESVLALNPRLSYRRLTAEKREGLFMTGILPSEAIAFARWLGEGFDLPTVEQWRAIYRALQFQRLSTSDFDGLVSGCSSEPARTILKHFWAGFTPSQRLLRQLSQMRHGVVEWVREEGKWVGLGAPRPTFFPNIFNPSTDVVRPFRPETERLHYFGFRLVRPGGRGTAHHPGW